MQSIEIAQKSGFPLVTPQGIWILNDRRLLAPEKDSWQELADSISDVTTDEQAVYALRKPEAGTPEVIAFVAGQETHRYPLSNDPYDIVNRDGQLLVHGNECLLLSADGAKSFKKMRGIDHQLDEHNFRDLVAFPTGVWLAASNIWPTLLFSSKDNGNSWLLLSEGETECAAQVWTAGSETAIALGNHESTLMILTECGKGREVVALPRMHHKVVDVLFDGQDTVYALTGEGRHLARSRDLGRHWELIATNLGGRRLQRFADRIYVLGLGVCLFGTTDELRNQKEIKLKRPKRPTKAAQTKAVSDALEPLSRGVFVEQLEAMLKKVVRQSGLFISHLHVTPPSSSDLDQLEQSLATQLPPRTRQLFSELGGIRLRVVNVVDDPVSEVVFSAKPFTDNDVSNDFDSELECFVINILPMNDWKERPGAAGLEDNEEAPEGIRIVNYDNAFHQESLIANIDGKIQLYNAADYFAVVEESVHTLDEYIDSLFNFDRIENSLELCSWPTT